MPPTPRLLTTEEAADYLRVSQATILRWCKAGLLPALRIGRQWRVDLRQLEVMLAGSVASGAPAREER